MRSKQGIPYPLPVCSTFKQFNELNRKAISFLGFGAWEWFAPVRFPEVSIKNCTGVYGVAMNYPKFGRKAPWLASISVDGEPVGSGILIDPLWVLTSLKPPFDEPNVLNKSYVSCRLGFLSVKGGPGPVSPFEKSLKVDKSVVFPQHGLALLRLKEPVGSSTAVKPLMLLDDVKRGIKDKCYAVGLECSSQIHVLAADRELCRKGQICYSVSPNVNVSYSHMSQVVGPTGMCSSGRWSGAVWCQDEADIPYLDCLFKNRTLCSGPCSFKCIDVFSHYSTLNNFTDKYRKLGTMKTEGKLNPDAQGRMKRTEELMKVKYPLLKQIFGGDYEYSSSENLGAEYDSDYEHSFGEMRDFFGDYMTGGRQYDGHGRMSRAEQSERQRRSIGRVHPGYPGHTIVQQTVEESYEETVEGSHHSLEQDDHESTEYEGYEEEHDWRKKSHSDTKEKSKARMANSDDSIKATSKHHTKKVSSQKKSANKDVTIIREFDAGVAATCLGVRCSCGTCIPWNKVQDGILDCPGGNDEDSSLNKTEHCLHHPLDCKCERSEISCGDGTCIPMEKFCDRSPDCPAGIDEPQSCSSNCSSYLSVKHPSWLCDGNPNCYDGSDESWTTCGPQAACVHEKSFKCSRSHGCLHSYQVCDGIKDCPHGDDELNCAAIESYPNRLWEGLLVRRVLGSWIPQCFTSHVPENELTAICHDLGWKGGLNGTEYSIRSVEVPALTVYSTFSLNGGAQYSLVSDRPAVQLQPAVTCLTLHITCK